MKRNINSTFCLNVLIFVLASTHNLAVAQNRPQQNIRRVTVTSQYVVVDGKYKNESSVINQELYDSLGRCHTEIDLGLTDHYPHNARWHYFEGKLKVKSVTFIDEKITAIEEFFYNSDSLLIQRIGKRINQNDTAVYLVLNYKYDISRNPIEITAKTAAGKVAYVLKSTFNQRGKELTRTVKVKKNFYPQDSIVKMVSTPTYDSIGRLVNEKTVITKADKSTSIKTVKYTYDTKNNQVGLLLLDANGKQIRREERAYNYSRNRLSLIKYYNSRDIMYNMIEKRYEIYRSKERKVREIEY